MIKENSQPSGVVCRNEKPADITYTVEKTGKKIIFAVTPIYRESGENLNQILIKLMQGEAKKP